MTSLIYPATIQPLPVIALSPEPGKPELSKLPLVDYALSYAQNGWYVFPLQGKIPFKESSGHIDATTKQQQIQTWWSQRPTAHIGLATGELSGVLVLDIDPPKGYNHLKELQGRYTPIADARRVSTANKGLHFFFHYPTDGNTYQNAVRLAGKEASDARGHLANRG